MRQRTTAAGQIILGIFMAAALLMTLEVLGEVVSSRGWQVDLSMGVDRQSFTLNQPSGRLSLKTRGDVRLDDHGVVSIVEGASLRIRETSPGKVRRLDVLGQADDTPKYRYRVNGKEQPFDDAKDWLHNVLVTYFRGSGADAPERAQRISDAGGGEALIEEIRHIESDHVLVTYLTELLLLDPLDEEHLLRGLEIARSAIESDYHLAEFLESAGQTWLDDETVARAILDIAKSLSSDHHLTTVLKSMIPSGSDSRLPPSLLGPLLDTGRAIDSDHHLADLLIAVAAYAPHHALPSNIAQTVGAISGDHHQARAIRAFFERPSLREENADGLLRVAASSIGSHHHAGEVLAVFAQEQRERAFPQGVFALLTAINSDHHQGQAARLLLAEARPADRVKVLNACRLSSDHEIAELLIAASEYDYEGVDVESTIQSVLSTIGSDYHRERASEAWAG